LKVGYFVNNKAGINEKDKPRLQPRLESFGAGMVLRPV